MTVIAQNPSIRTAAAKLSKEKRGFFLRGGGIAHRLRGD
jgi:hypothetical protein